MPYLSYNQYIFHFDKSSPSKSTFPEDVQVYGWYGLAVAGRQPIANPNLHLEGKRLNTVDPVRVVAD